MKKWKWICRTCWATGEFERPVDDVIKHRDPAISIHLAAPGDRCPNPDTLTLDLSPGPFGDNPFQAFDRVEYQGGRNWPISRAVVGFAGPMYNPPDDPPGEASKWIVAIVPDRSFEQILVWDHDLKRVD